MDVNRSARYMGHISTLWSLPHISGENKDKAAASLLLKYDANAEEANELKTKVLDISCNVGDERDWSGRVLLGWGKCQRKGQGRTNSTGICTSCIWIKESSWDAPATSDAGKTRYLGTLSRDLVWRFHETRPHETRYLETTFSKLKIG